MVPEQRARAFARARQVRLLQRGALLDAYEVPAAFGPSGTKRSGTTGMSCSSSVMEDGHFIFAALPPGKSTFPKRNYYFYEKRVSK